MRRLGQQEAVDAGPTGNTGRIGWYVPPWLAAAHLDILRWENLNTYASKFVMSESGGKGQLLDGDPAFVTNDQALVTNLKLDHKVVFSGSGSLSEVVLKKAEVGRQQPECCGWLK